MISHSKAVIVLTIMVIGGCATSSNSPLDELAKNDAVIGTAGGAALGAGVGYLLAGKEGAKWGTLAGAGAGFIAGNIAAKRRQQFASEEEFLNTEIASAETAISAKEAQLAALEGKVKSARTEVSQLEARFRKNQNITAEAERKNEELSAQIAQGQGLAQQYQNSIDYLNEVITTSRSDASATEAEKGAAKTRLASLERKRSELSTQYARLNGINQDLKREQDILLALLKRSRPART